MNARGKGSTSIGVPRGTRRRPTHGALGAHRPLPLPSGLPCPLLAQGLRRGDLDGHLAPGVLLDAGVVPACGTEGKGECAKAAAAARARYCTQCLGVQGDATAVSGHGALPCTHALALAVPDQGPPRADRP